jgi:hypothetical protein
MEVDPPRHGAHSETHRDSAPETVTAPSGGNGTGITVDPIDQASEEEDPFGHGGGLDEHDGCDATREGAPARSADNGDPVGQRCSNAGCVGELMGNAGYRRGQTRGPGQAELEAGPSARERLQAIRERVKARLASNEERRQVNGAIEEKPQCSVATRGLETEAVARRPGEVVQGRVEATDASSCVVVAREGPGDPKPSALTVAAAGQPAAPAAATVALGADAILLSSGVLIAGHTDGAAAPSDDSRPSAVSPHGREQYFNPQAMPVVEGGGGPQTRSAYPPQAARGSRRAGLRKGEEELCGTRDAPPS